MPGVQRDVHDSFALQFSPLSGDKLICAWKWAVRAGSRLVRGQELGAKGEEVPEERGPTEASPQSRLSLQPLVRARLRPWLGTCVLGISTGTRRKCRPDLGCDLQRSRPWGGVKRRCHGCFDRGGAGCCLASKERFKKHPKLEFQKERATGQWAGWMSVCAHSEGAARLSALTCAPQSGVGSSGQTRSSRAPRCSERPV